MQLTVFPIFLALQGLQNRQSDLHIKCDEVKEEWLQ